METSADLMSPPDWQTVAWTLGGMWLVLWGIRFLDGLIWKEKLNKSFSIVPRASFGVTRILFAPLMHQDRGHLRNNIVPLTILALLLLLTRYDWFWAITLIIVVIEGVATWLFGSKGNHLGASGIVLGYFGFILGQLQFSETLNPLVVLVAGAVAVGYRHLFREIFPWRAGTSNVGHLFGFLGGIAAAYLLPAFNALPAP